VTGLPGAAAAGVPGVVGLVEPEAILVINETGDDKKGT